jgi:hypothetical protein
VLTALAILAGAVVSGCGGSTARHTVCTAATRQAVANAAGVQLGKVRATASTSSEGYPQCVLHAGSLTVTAQDYVSTQSYFLLERTQDEYAQIFGTPRLIAPPVHVPGLGLDAGWIPSTGDLLTTDGRRLVTVYVSGAGLKQAAKIALATKIARPYLGKNDYKVTMSP